MGRDGSQGVSVYPWRAATAQVFVDDLDAPVVGTEDARHLSRVIRLRAGEIVCAADGRGRYRLCAYTDQSTLEPTGEIVSSEPPKYEVSIAFVPVKGDRPEWVVQKLTELGVDRIMVTQSERSVVRWDETRAAKALEKLNRSALEACKQSRRLFIPPVEWVDMATISGAALADSGGRAALRSDTSLVVGPEGGWTDGERSGRDLVGLSDNILRAETAAVVAGTTLTSLRLGLSGEGLS